jgi:hypothetical protein
MDVVGWIVLKWLKYDMEAWIEFRWARRSPTSELVGKK